MVSSAREVETKYDLDVDAVLPDLTGLPGVARIAGPEVHDLAATYFDTLDLRLATSGITLRRRTGGDDAGWHLKLPVDGARQEIHAPLGTTTSTPPAALRRIVDGVVRQASLAPVADLHTERRVLSLLDDDDRVLALVCDDRVIARRPGLGGDQVSTWRECEVELHHGGRKLTRAAHDRLEDAGIHPSAHGSKLGRALDVAVAAPRRTRVTATKRTSVHDLLQAELGALTTDLVRLDPLVRGDVPDAVHQMRVTGRKLRGILETFGRAFDPAVTEPVSGGLRWLVRELGRPRDLEVLRDRLGAMAEAEDPALVRDDVRRWMDNRMRVAHGSAHREAEAALQSERYASLVSELESWVGSPPWSDAEDEPARKVLGRAVAREWRLLERAVRTADKGRKSDEHVALLHEVRRAAKRTRYAAEAIAPVAGKDARRLASATAAIQGALGDHHDTAGAARQLLVLADAARAAGLDTFTFGLLHARLDAVLAADERRYERAWRAANRRRVTRWLS